MALNLVQKKKQQQILILVLVAVMLVTVTVLWFGYFKQTPVVVVNEELPQGEGAVKPIPQQVEINFGALSLPVLEELNAPEEPIEEPQVKGRSNPFLPF